MNKQYDITQRLYIFIVLLVLLSACAKNSPIASEYRAINGKDTAELILTIDDNQFHGTYTINYPGGKTDSGYIRGDIRGDTLIGSFRYRPYDMAHFRRVPIALLKGNDGILIQGKGHVAVYMNIPYFWEKTPIRYDDPEFIFKPTP